MLQRDDRHRGGEAGGADDHRFPGGETSGERHDPLGLDSGVLGEPTVLGDTDVVAVGDDLGTGGQITGSFEQHTGEVDTGHHRRNTRHFAGGRGGQAVLVGHAGVVHFDEHTVGGQFILGHGDDAAIDTFTGRVGAERAERVNGHGSTVVNRPFQPHFKQNLAPSGQ